MKHILVPTDFSATAERALRYALDMAARSAMTVTLYHVYDPVESEFVSSEDIRKEFNQQTEATLIKKMQRLKKKVTENGNDVPVAEVLGRSPVVDNILGFAEANRIDMIVMGTQGAGNLKKTIVGSVASRVADNAGMPVLLIPEKFEWKDPKQIVFAANYSDSDKEALAFVLSIAKAYNANVTVLHLLNAYLNESEKEKEKTGFDSYAFYLQKEFDQYKVKFKLLETTSVIETMERLDKLIPYDLIVMVRREKGFYEKFFLGSFTQSMAYITKLPLLVIPEEKVEKTDKNRKNITEGISYIPHKSEIKVKKIRKTNKI